MNYPSPTRIIHRILLEMGIFFRRGVQNTPKGGWGRALPSPTAPLGCCARADPIPCSRGFGIGAGTVQGRGCCFLLECSEQGEEHPSHPGPPAGLGSLHFGAVPAPGAALGSPLWGSPCDAAAPSPPLQQPLFPKGARPSPPPLPGRFRERLPWRRGRNWICSPAGINPSCCLLLLSSQRIFNKVTVYRSLVFVLLSLCCVLNPEGFHHNLLLSQALQIPPLLHELCPLDPGDISFPMVFIPGIELNW